MKTIRQYKEIWDKTKDNSIIKAVLDHTIAQISFLESIYMTGGLNHVYSEEFADSAHRERQELCQLSSALYSILDERK